MGVSTAPLIRRCAPPSPAGRRKPRRRFYALEPETLASTLGDYLSAVCPTQIAHRRNSKEELVKIAITGGTGFVGRHLAQRLAREGVEVVSLSRRTGVAVDDAEALAAALAGCDAVAHCAGINRELGSQTYERVHVEGTRAVVEAARRAGVRKILMLSFLRARPNCGSPYHESKWAAEELVRGSGLDFTIVKAGMIYVAATTCSTFSATPCSPAAGGCCSPTS